MVNWWRESFTEETLHLNIIPRGLWRVLLREITFNCWSLVGLSMSFECRLGYRAQTWRTLGIIIKISDNSSHTVGSRMTSYDIMANENYRLMLERKRPQEYIYISGTKLTHGAIRCFQEYWVFFWEDSNFIFGHITVRSLGLLEWVVWIHTSRQIQQSMSYFRTECCSCGFQSHALHTMRNI